MRAAQNRSAHNRSALIWLAVAAVTLACVARGQAGVDHAAYSNPVLQFLAGQESSASFVAAAVPHLQHSSRQHHTDSGAWMAAMLPVFFIGLVAPLNLISSRAILSLGRPPAPPALPFSFQRPPPSFLL